MMTISTALSMVISGMDEVLSELGFKPFYPQDAPRDTLPLVEENGRSFVTLVGERGSLRLLHGDNRLSLGWAETQYDGVAELDFTRFEEVLLEPETVEAKDISFIAQEFSDTLRTKLGAGKKPAQGSGKLPQTVSKSAVKSGVLSYDAVTLGNRFTVIYPELRQEYKDNIDRYGDFLAEDFFINYGAPVAIETIKSNDKIKIRKLFNLLNDIYDDGTNDLQSLIAVTILGGLGNDEELLARCVDYMSTDLGVAVIQVNRYLASDASKGVRIKLEHPPKYKPKKAKKKSIMDRLSGMQQ